MRSRRIADERDALGVDAQLSGLGPDVLHRRFDVVNGAGIGLHSRLHQPVLDGKNGIAVLGKIRAPVRVEFAIADLPSAAVHSDQYRSLVASFGQIKIPDQLGPVVIGELDVGSGNDGEVFSHRFHTG